MQVTRLSLAFSMELNAFAGGAQSSEESPPSVTEGASDISVEGDFKDKLR